VAVVVDVPVVVLLVTVILCVCVLDVVDIVEVVVRVKEEVVVVSLEDDVLATNSLTLQEGMSEQPSQK